MTDPDVRPTRRGTRAALGTRGFVVASVLAVLVVVGAITGIAYANRGAHSDQDRPPVNPTAPPTAPIGPQGQDNQTPGS